MKYFVFVNYEFHGELVEFNDLEEAFEYYQKESKDNQVAILYGFILNGNYDF